MKKPKMKLYLRAFLFASILGSGVFVAEKVSADPFYWINYYWNVQDCANVAGSLGYPYYQVSAGTCNLADGGGTAACVACWGSYN